MEWMDAIRVSGLSIAYIGPIITPIIYKHAEMKKLNNIYVVLEKLYSKVYQFEKQTAYQYSLPFGTAQLCNSDDQNKNLILLSNQVANVLKANESNEQVDDKVIIPIGWPANKSQHYRLFNRNYEKAKISSLESTSKGHITDIASNCEDYLLVKDLCFAAKSCMEFIE